MAAVVLLNLGGPSGPEQIYPFLRNLFSDPMIIQLPGGRLIQPLFARLIATLRTPKVREYYKAIGGGSPLLSLTREQGRALVRELEHRGHPDVRVEVVMRYLPPTAADHHYYFTLYGLFLMDAHIPNQPKKKMNL